MIKNEDQLEGWQYSNSINKDHYTSVWSTGDAIIKLSQLSGWHLCIFPVQKHSILTLTPSSDGTSQQDGFLGNIVHYTPIIQVASSRCALQCTDGSQISLQTSNDQTEFTARCDNPWSAAKTNFKIIAETHIEIYINFVAEYVRANGILWSAHCYLQPEN